MQQVERTLTAEKDELSEPLAVAQSMISLSLIAMWTSVGFRLCALVPMMGPLIRMMEFLVTDVLRWFARSEPSAPSPPSPADPPPEPSAPSPRAQRTLNTHTVGRRAV